MRLLNYLTEDVEKLFLQLERNCSQFIKEMKAGENLLLRVRSDYSQKPLIFVIKGRTGREPKDTPLIVQKKIDELLKSKFGWKPRADGLFAWIQKRNVKNIKRNMGRIIFPANGYKYVYNPKVVDLYNFMTFFISSEIDVDDMDVNVDEKFFTYFKDTLLDEYTNKNAMKFKVGRNDIECMINAPFFYAIAPEMTPRLNEKFGLDISLSSYKPGFW